MVLTWSDWLKLFNLSLGPKEFQVSQRTIYPALTVLSDFTSLGRTTRCNFKAPWVSTGRNQPITHTCRDTRNYIFISVTGRIWTILTPTRCMWKSMYDHVLDLFQLLSYLTFMWHTFEITTLPFYPPQPEIIAFQSDIYRDINNNNNKQIYYHTNS